MIVLLISIKINDRPTTYCYSHKKTSWVAWYLTTKSLRYSGGLSSDWSLVLNSFNVDEVNLATGPHWVRLRAHLTLITLCTMRIIRASYTFIA